MQDIAFIYRIGKAIIRVIEHLKLKEVSFGILQVGMMLMKRKM